MKAQWYDMVFCHVHVDAKSIQKHPKQRVVHPSQRSSYIAPSFLLKASCKRLGSGHDEKVHVLISNHHCTDRDVPLHSPTKAALVEATERKPCALVASEAQAVPGTPWYGGRYVILVCACICAYTLTPIEPLFTPAFRRLDQGQQTCR